MFGGEQEGSAGEVIGGSIGLAFDLEGVGGSGEPGHFKVSDLHWCSRRHYGTFFGETEVLCEASIVVR